MGVARFVVTMAIIGIAGGAGLAIATIPALTPFRGNDRDRREEQPRVVFDDSGTKGNRGYAGPDQAHDDNGFSIEAGPREGSVVLQLPRWAQDTGEWFSFGSRALREWREWTDPGEGATEQGAHSERLAQPLRRDERSYGYLEQRPDRPRRNAYAEVEGANVTGERSIWVSPIDQLLQQPRSQRDTGTAGAAAPAEADSAAAAAASAREAARDVQAAEDSSQ